MDRSRPGCAVEALVAGDGGDRIRDLGSWVEPAAAQSGIISAQVQALQAALIGVGPGTAMFDQAGAVRNDLVGDNTAQACDDLQGLINHTKAQAGKQLT